MRKEKEKNVSNAMKSVAGQAQIDWPRVQIVS